MADAVERQVVGVGDRCAQPAEVGGDAVSRHVLTQALTQLTKVAVRRTAPFVYNPDVPEELKARTDTRGESSLRGHLKGEGQEETGSQSYIPPDAKNDKALNTALDLIRGIQKNSAYPPNSNSRAPVPN